MQTDDATTKSPYSSSTRRLVATLAAVATVAFAASAAAPSVSSAQAAAGGCPEWMCGTNHNEVMATASAA
jgi:hypothetical protein